MKLTLNISPCPNDTFMFDALINRRIDTEGLDFDVQFVDIEELNRQLLLGKPQVSKASYAVVPRICTEYAVLDSGSALGRGNGPLLVSVDAQIDVQNPNLKVAVAGLNTTSSVLMTKFFPHLTHKTPVLFSEITNSLLDKTFDLGVLIHEGRFTYAEKGLHLVADLGKLWEEQTNLPLPLGAIVASRNLPIEIIRKIERLIRKSVEFAFANPTLSKSFVASNAQELSTEIIDQHIALFVNDFSISLNQEGRNAIHNLLNLSPNPNQIF